MSKILTAEGICKKYNDADGYVIKDFSLSLSEGEIVALIGESGCGKSTLLHILGLLDDNYAGTVKYAGTDVRKLERATTICANFGFVYQFHNLLQEFTAEENVMLPQLVMRVAKDVARTRAKELLTVFGLGEKCKSLPAELSGGQKQRVAIARAMANSPKILLADEPTGSLDANTSKMVMDELLNILKAFHISAIIATHSADVANMLDGKIRLEG